MNQVTYPIKEIDGRLKLKIPIKIINPQNKKSFPVMALLDTGADTCIFPSMISRTIGLEYNESSKRKNGTR